MDGVDPNGAHAIEFGKLCKCGAELCHPSEIKMGQCYPCSTTLCHACGNPKTGARNHCEFCE